MSDSITLYEALGGAEKLRDIVERFYPKVQAHPLLGPLFPEDIAPVAEKQILFLTQLLGGPHLYSDLYGHPMMRARHMAFPITPERADAWLACMEAALGEAEVPEPVKEIVLERLSGPARHFINTDSTSHI